MTVALGRLTQDGIWVSGGPQKAPAAIPGLLLDRDGVLVEEVNYLHRREDVRLAPGAGALLRWAADQGLPVAVVTNQAGIARGMFDWDDFLSVQEEIGRQLADEGASVDLTLACPFHPEHTAGWNESHAHWRKPGPGMLQLAAELLNLDPSLSWMVGDNESDVAAARAAGLKGALHLLTGHGATYRDAALVLATPRFEVVPVDDLLGGLTALCDRYHRVF